MYVYQRGMGTIRVDWNMARVHRDPTVVPSASSGGGGGEGEIEGEREGGRALPSTKYHPLLANHWPDISTGEHYVSPLAYLPLTTR